jgi:hypothetical protein
MLHCWDIFASNWFYFHNLDFGTNFAVPFPINPVEEGFYVAKYLSC